MNRMEHSPLERDSSSCWGFRGTGWLSKGGQREGKLLAWTMESIYTTGKRRGGYIRPRGGENDRNTERHDWGHEQALYTEMNGWVRGP